MWTPPTYRPWTNAVLYESVWLVGVLGRESLVPLAFALVALHVALCRSRRTELALMLGVTAIGVTADSLLTLGGVFAFDPMPGLLPIPLWLVPIWLAFAATFRHALAPLFARPPLVIALGAIGGPLSYVGAAKLDAVTLPLGTTVTALVLGIVWTLLMTLFVAAVRALEPAPRPAPVR